MRWPKRKKESKYPEAIRPEVLEAAEAAGIADGYKLEARAVDGFAMMKDGRAVIVSAAIELDGRAWLHVSCSYKNFIPGYDTMKSIKAVFIGPERKAVQVFAPESEHVNLMDTALHLWACLDGDVFPDFTRGGGTI